MEHLMGSHTESPVRSALRDAIFNVITTSTEPMTVADITAALGDEDAREIARLCYELRTKAGLIEFGEPRFVHAQGKDMKTYRAMAVDSAEAWAARTAASMAIAKAQAPKKAKNSTAQPASDSHPWKQPAVPPKAPRAPRVTRPLPTHLQSVAPPPVAIEEPPIATIPVVAYETPVDAPQTDGPFILAGSHIVLKPQDDIDIALIDALKQVLPAMQRAAADLPKAIDPPTTEEETMTEPTATYGQDTDPGTAPAGFTWSPALGHQPEHFVLTPDSAEDDAPAHECQGHCSNRAKADDAMWAALRKDDHDDQMEEIRLGLVDSLLIYANWTLRDDPVWKAMLRPYVVAAGSSLEVCHG
jgi:hypothetical protein